MYSSSCSELKISTGPMNAPRFSANSRETQVSFSHEISKPRVGENKPLVRESSNQ